MSEEEQVEEFRRHVSIAAGLLHPECPATPSDALDHLTDALGLYDLKPLEPSNAYDAVEERARDLDNRLVGALAALRSPEHTTSHRLHNAIQTVIRALHMPDMLSSKDTAK